MKKQTIKIPKLKTRIIWGFNPASRVKPSKKIYNRNKYRQNKSKQINIISL